MLPDDAALHRHQRGSSALTRTAISHVPCAEAQLDVDRFGGNPAGALPRQVGGLFGVGDDAIRPRRRRERSQVRLVPAMITSAPRSATARSSRLSAPSRSHAASAPCRALPDPSSTLASCRTAGAAPPNREERHLFAAAAGRPVGYPAGHHRRHGFGRWTRAASASVDNHPAGRLVTGTGVAGQRHTPLHGHRPSRRARLPGLARGTRPAATWLEGRAGIAARAASCA